MIRGDSSSNSSKRKLEYSQPTKGQTDQGPPKIGQERLKDEMRFLTTSPSPERQAGTSTSHTRETPSLPTTDQGERYTPEWLDRKIKEYAAKNDGWTPDDAHKYVIDRLNIKLKKIRDADTSSMTEWLDENVQKYARKKNLTSDDARQYLLNKLQNRYQDHWKQYKIEQLLLQQSTDATIPEDVTQSADGPPLKRRKLEVAPVQDSTGQASSKEKNLSHKKLTDALSEYYTPRNYSRRWQPQQQLGTTQPDLRQTQTRSMVEKTSSDEYMSGSGDQTPKARNQEAGSSSLTEETMHQKEVRGLQALYSELTPQYNEKLEEFKGNETGSFKLARIDTNILRDVMESHNIQEDIKRMAKTVCHYVERINSGSQTDCTEEEALQAISNLEERAKQVGINSLIHEFKRLNDDHDKSLVDKARDNPYPWLNK